VLLLVALSCSKSDADTAGPPLGIVIEQDDVTYAGASAIDMTPEITELWDDQNGDGNFTGCMEDVTGADCGEGFDDADGDGWFDAVWIGGFGPLRAARDVHDPVWARATVMSHNGEYIAFVALDYVGLGSPRIHEARDRLAAEGFDLDRLIVASSHNHQGPDTMGLWGNPYNLSDPVSGIDEAYQQRVTDAIEQAVRDAADAMEPVTLTVGRTRMRDESVWFNGANFGGKNPTAKVHGMIYDGRDPVVVSDQLLVLQGVGESGTVFTLTNWSGHPEVRGSDNNSISSDWVGVTREVLEAEYGGVALHLPECLGGMQSALGADLPLVEDDGTHVFTDTVDDDGDQVPEWAERNSWAFVTSHGWHIAEAAIEALTAGETIEATPIRVEAESVYVPIDNIVYQLLGPEGVFDLDLDDTTDDPELCPEPDNGCIETRTFRLQVGPIGFVAVPGELLPELAWGFPDEASWESEAQDVTARGADATWFLQHPRECDTVSWEACREELDTIDGCACLDMHAVPYTLRDGGNDTPLLDHLDTDYRAVIGMADDYLSYIIPEPDVHRSVSLLSPNGDGDHYEDTVSPTRHFAPGIQDAQQAIADRW